MRIYWLVMSGLLLFPWSLVLAPAIAHAYKRLSSGAHHRNGLTPRAWIFLALFVILATATVTFAAEPVVTPLERLHDGTRDLATGWTKFVRVIVMETAERGPVDGFLVGSIKGSHQALSETTRGAYETATFFLSVPRPQSTPSEPGHLLEVRF
ncbi:MAG: hypothetical protein ACREJ6_13910 [Candidatus Methylomirabilis sp.]